MIVAMKIQVQNMEPFPREALQSIVSIEVLANDERWRLRKTENPQLFYQQRGLLQSTLKLHRDHRLSLLGPIFFRRGHSYSTCPRQN